MNWHFRAFCCFYRQGNRMKKTAEYSETTVSISHITRCHVKRCHVTRCHVTRCHVTRCHVTRCHVTWCHVTRCHVTRCHITRCHITRCHVTRCHITRYHITRCHVTRCHITRCHITRCHIPQQTANIVNSYSEELKRLRQYLQNFNFRWTCFGGNKNIINWIKYNHEYFLKHIFWNTFQFSYGLLCGWLTTKWTKCNYGRYISWKTYFVTTVLCECCTAYVANVCFEILCRICPVNCMR
jgi:hypothetical protein